MPRPSPVIKVGLAIPPETIGDTYDPKPYSGWWWDISEYVRDIPTIDGGRQRDLDTIEAGTAKLILDNFDRSFEPGAGLGLGGGLINVGGDGFGGGFNQHIRIVAGYFAEMINNIAGDAPQQWWRLNDRGLIITANNILNPDNTEDGRDGLYNGSPELGGKGFLAGTTCPNFDGVDDYINVSPLASETFLDLSTGFCMGIVIAPDALPASAAGLIVRADAGDANPGQYNLLLTSAGEIQYLSGTGSTVTTTGAGIVAGGGPYVIVVNYNDVLSPRCKIYVNGVERGSGNPDTPVVSSLKDLLIGRRGTGGFYDGRLAEAWIRGNGFNFSESTIQATYDEFIQGHADGYFFYGYADGWPQEYPTNGKDALVHLDATDAFKIFANVDLPPSPFALEMETEMSLTRGWWRLSAPQASLETFNSGVGVLGSEGDDKAVAIGGSPNWVDGLVTNDVDGAVILPDDVYLRIPESATIGGDAPGYFSFGGVQFTIDCLIQREGDPPVDQVIYEQNGSGTADGQTQVRCFLNPDGTLGFTVVLAGLLFTTATTVTVTDGLPHHVRFHRRAVTGPTGTIKIYVDGVERATLNVNNVGGCGGANFGVIGPADGTVIDELIIEDTSSTAASFEGTFTAAEMYSHMRTPWRNKRTDEAVTRILDWMGWATAKRDIGSGETVLGEVSFDEKALTTLQRLAETEDTRLYMAPDGKLTFYGRDAYRSQGLVDGYGVGDMKARFGNLIDNWSFETDLAGWTVDAPGGRDGGTGYHGRSSVWLNDNSAGSALRMTQDSYSVRVRPGQTLRLTAWVLPQTGTTTMTLQFEYSDATTVSSQVTVTPNVWQRIALDFTVPDGKLLGRAQIYPTDAVAASQGKAFVDAVRIEPLPYVEPLALNWDEVNVVNQTRLARAGGAERLQEDTVSVAEHGPRSFDKTDLMHLYDEEVIDRGNWIIDQHANVHLELRSLPIRPVVNADLWHEALNRRFGDKIKVWVQPPARYGSDASAVGEPILKTVRIEQVSHSANLKAGTWKTEWQLSAADDDVPWMLGNTTFGILGTTTKLGY